LIMMPTSYVTSVWTKLDFDSLKRSSTSQKNFHRNDDQGLPATFRVVLIGSALLTSMLLMLRVLFIAIDATVYSRHLQTVFDILIAIITPVTAVYLHRLLKARMIKQVQEYRTLFKENPQAMWLYDTSTLKFLMVNDAAVALYGYTTEEFLRMRVCDIRPAEETPAILNEEQNRQINSLEKYHWSGTWRHKTKYNKEIYAEVSSYEVTFNGKPAALALSYNVTEKVLQELKLVTLNQELEQKVKERTNDLLLSNRKLVNQNYTIKKANHELAKVTEALQTANEKLKEHTERKSQFVSIVSHEFRSPLSSIRFGAEYIHKNYDRLTKEQLLEKVHNISRTIDQMEVLLNDVLTIQKSESPKIQANVEDVNIQKFITAIANEVSQATKNTHHICINAEKLPEKIGSDEKLLRNIFLNLLTNAIKYSGDSRIVNLRAYAEPGSITIEVQDHGIGIHPEYMQKIFEPFYRTPDVKEIQGTGLGLSIVKRAVDAMGGKMNVRSEISKGSTFTVTLPARPNIQSIISNY
jgi:PAS domain S-box-containing protein